MNTTLIICRELTQVPLLSRLRPESGCLYVVASDDVRVQAAAKQYLWVNDVCWIEQMESFYAVANDVIRILRMELFERAI